MSEKRDLPSATSAGRRMTEEEKESRRQLAKRLYESGLNAAEIGDVLRLSRERVRKILMEAGVKMRTSSSSPDFAKERQQRIERGVEAVESADRADDE